MKPKIVAPQRSSNPAATRKVRTSSSTQSRTADYRLQESIGNAATARLLRSIHIQAKLNVSNPGDESEREADRVADDVMRMPDPQAGLAVQRSPLKIQRVCTGCEDEEKRFVQTKPLIQRDGDLEQSPELSTTV